MSWACVVARVARTKRSPAGIAGAGAKDGRRPVPRSERRAGKAHHVLVGDVAGSRHDHVRRAVVGAPEAVDRVRGKRPDALLGARDLAAERSVVEDGQVEEHADVLGRVVEVGADLLDDDVALLLDLLLVQERAGNELAEHGHGERGVAGRHADVVDGGLAVGRGVEGPADPLHGLGERPRRRVGARPLEREVLHEVGAAGLVSALVARAGEHVRLDRDRPGAGKSRGDDARPVGQRRAFEHRAEG